MPLNTVHRTACSHASVEKVCISNYRLNVNIIMMMMLMTTITINVVALYGRAGATAELAASKMVRLSDLSNQYTFYPGASLTKRALNEMVL